MESAIAEGQRIHYNFVKPHQTLEGMTPSQRAYIPIENKWSELLKLALTNQLRTSGLDFHRQPDPEQNREFYNAA